MAYGTITKLLMGIMVIAMVFYAGGWFLSDLNTGYNANIAQGINVSSQSQEVKVLTSDIAGKLNETSGDYSLTGYTALVQGGLTTIKLIPSSLGIVISTVGAIFTGLSPVIAIDAYYLQTIYAILAIVIFMTVLAIVLGRQSGTI